MTNTKLAEALAQFEAALLFAYPEGARGAAFDCWNKARQALAAHEAEQAQEPVLQDIEQYRMQMAGISTAALGYWKEGDGIHPDYDTVALRDVAKLYAKYDQLFQQKQAAQAVPADMLPSAEHIKEIAGELVTQAMEQAQVFASAWALVGSRFDAGNEMDNAEQQKADLRTIIQTLADLAAETVRPIAAAPAAPAPEAPKAAPAGLYVGVIERLMRLSTRLGLANGDSIEHFAASLEDRLYAICRCAESLLDSLAAKPAAPAPEAQDSARTSPVHQPVHGWTDADADAARLALELECLLTDGDVPMPVTSRWWESAHEALALHRQRLASEQSHGIAATTGEQHG